MSKKHVAYFGVADTYIAEGETFTGGVAVEVTDETAEKLVALDPGFKVVNKDGSIAKAQPKAVPAASEGDSAPGGTGAGSGAPTTVGGSTTGDAGSGAI